MSYNRSIYFDRACRAAMCALCSETVTKQSLNMASRSTAEILGANVEESLTRCEPELLEYSIDAGRESLRMKMLMLRSHRRQCGIDIP